jgi:hypothetical protein
MIKRTDEDNDEDEAQPHGHEQRAHDKRVRIGQKCTKIRGNQNGSEKFYIKIDLIGHSDMEFGQLFFFQTCWKTLSGKEEGRVEEEVIRI